jgi:hypothetical protein
MSRSDKVQGSKNRAPAAARAAFGLAARDSFAAKIL